MEISLPLITFFSFLCRKHMNRVCLALFIVVLPLCFVYSQEVKCGLPDPSAIKEQMLLNRLEVPFVVERRENITYVPVKFFLIAESNGSGRITENKVLDMLCELNANYADQNMQFYIKDGLAYYDNSGIYNTPTSSFSQSLLREIKRGNAINVFITKEAGEGSAAFYQPPARYNDWIVIRNQFVSDPRVLTHEFGHFFSLPHTFHGWDTDPWNATKHGNPVGKFAPDRVTLNEFADGTNCDPNKLPSNNNAGDGICDTPADYNFGSATCSYSLNVKDPNGINVKPQENNYMNYFFGCSNYIFTPGQKKEITRSLNSSSRDYLRSNYQPNIKTITEQTTLVSPENRGRTLNDTKVTLKWKKSANADYYLVELDVSPTMDYDLKTFVTNEDSIIIDRLIPEKNYFWRIRPFNEYSTCATPSETRRFITAKTTSTRPIDGIQSINFFPTIITGYTPPQLHINAETPINAQLSIIDVQGKIINPRLPIRIVPGFNNLSVDVQNLTSGLYILHISTADGVYNTKFIIP